jgi:hypothetical protein
LLSGTDAKQGTLGAEFDVEFNALATAVNSKANTASPTFTGTATIPTVDGATISGGTY